MSQSAYTIRLDSDLKKRFDTLCEGFGMSASTAFNIFVRAVVRQRKIPFEIEMPEEDVIWEENRQPNGWTSKTLPFFVEKNANCI